MSEGGESASKPARYVISLEWPQELKGVAQCIIEKIKDPHLYRHTIPESPPQPEDDGTDETGLEEKDIELVMQQTSVTRENAVRALRSAKGDVINAIMELSPMFE